MTPIFKHALKALSLATLATLAACGGGGSDTPTGPQSVAIQFAAVAGSSNTPVSCSSTLTGLGTNPVSAQLTDLRFYLTDVQLVNDQGVAVPVTLASNEWQYTSGSNTVTLIDLENAQFACASEGTTATHASVTGTVPAGNYVRLRATVGVPETLSHSDVMAAAAPLDLMAMGWSWQAGRKFAKIEVNPVGGVTNSDSSVSATYYEHIASTDCTGPGNGTDTCAKKNLTQIDIPFNPGTQQVALDLATLLAGSNIRVNQNGAGGCMSDSSDADCPAVFAKLGLDLATGGQASTAQTVFRAIAK